MVRVFDRDGAIGTGYSYTIGTGGSAIVALLRGSSGALAHRSRRRIDRGNLARSCCSPRMRRRSARSRSLALAAVDTALWDLSLPARQAPAFGRRRRRQDFAAAVHHRRRMAASRARRAGRRRARGQGAGLRWRQDQDRPAACRRGRRAPRRGARRGRRRLGHHDRCQSGLHPAGGDPSRAASGGARHRMVRGADARRRRRARIASWRDTTSVADRDRRVALQHLAVQGLPARRGPARSCRSTSRASAASRRGSRSRTWPRRSTSRYARTS